MIRSLCSLVVAALILGGVVTGGTDAASGATPMPGAAPTSGMTGPKILPDPENFDPATTTDNEILRLRSRLGTEFSVANVADVVARNTVIEVAAQVDEAKADRDRAQADHTALTVLLAGTAVDSFLTDTVTASAPGFVPSLEHLTGETLSNFASEQIVVQRSAAEGRLAQAEAHLRNTRAMLRDAESRAAETGVAAAEAADRLARFESRALLQRAAATRADALAARISDEIELRSVAGAIIVSAEIEAAVDLMITDAREAGINLTGGGYRSYESQVQLRLAHCGGMPPAGLRAGDEGAPATDDHANAGDPHAGDPNSGGLSGGALDAWRHYVIHEAPSGSCSPPTAPPGRSQHQLGLAIDFVEDGATLTSRSRAFVWLSQYAADYGFYNLASEPWHWSTTGH